MPTLQATFTPSASISSLLVASGAGFYGPIYLQIVVGKSTGAPATLAGLASPSSTDFIYLDNVTIARNQSGIAFSVTTRIPSIGVLHDTLWVGIWESGAAGGDAPMATAGPFVVGL